MTTVAPVATFHGTDPQSLLTAVCDAGFALQVAIERLKATAPNGRDYATAEDFEAARDQYTRRLESLQQVRNELEADSIAISELMD